MTRSVLLAIFVGVFVLHLVWGKNRSESFSGGRPQNASSHDQLLSDIYRLLASNGALVSFSTCQGFISDLLSDRPTCFLPRDVLLSSLHVFGTAFKTIGHFEQTLLSSDDERNANTNVSLRMREYFTDEQEKDVVAALSRLDVNSEWNVWRNRCNCSEFDEGLKNSSEARRRRSAISRDKQEACSDCLLRTEHLANRLKEALLTIVRIAGPNLTDRLLPARRPNATIFVHDLPEMTDNIDLLLIGINAIKTLHRLGQDLQIVERFSKSLLTRLDKPITLENFTEESSNIFCVLSLCRQATSWCSRNYLSDDIIRLCPEHCNDLSQILGAIDKISVSSHMPGSLTFLRHTANTHCARYSKSATQCAVIDNGEVYVQNHTNNSTNLTGKFCANFTCHFPLQPTAYKDHSWKRLTKVLRRIGDDWSMAAGRNQSDSALSPAFLCGMHCFDIGYHEDDAKRPQIVLTFVGYVTTALSLTAGVVFFRHRHRITALARRLIAYMNIAFVLYCLNYLALPFESGINAWGWPCHSDGTLKISKANGFDQCVFNATWNVFITIFLVGLAVGAAHAWYRLVQLLHGAGHVLDKQQEVRLERVYLLASFVFSLVLTAVVITQSQIEGTPLIGGCFPHRDDWYLYYGPVFGVAFIVGFSHLLWGIPRLLKLHKHSRQSSVRKNRKLNVRARLRGQSTSSIGSEGETSSGLLRLIKLFSLYLVFSIIQFVVFFSVSTYNYFTNSAEKTDMEVLDHVTCLMTSCDPGSCPPTPRYSPWPLIVLLLCTLMLSCLLATWAFRRTYWIGCLPSVARDRCGFQSRGSTPTKRLSLSSS